MNQTVGGNSYITFPTSALLLLERCFGLPQGTILTNNSLNTNSLWKSDWHFAHNPSVHVALPLIPESSGNVNLIHSDCPVLHGQSTIAQASFFIATVASLTHLLLVLVLSGGLISLYGSCLLTAIGFSSLQCLLLFAGGFGSSRMRNMINNTTANDNTFWSGCLLNESLLHSVTLTVHLGVLCCLHENYRKLRINRRIRSTHTATPVYKCTHSSYGPSSSYLSVGKPKTTDRDLVKLSHSSMSLSCYQGGVATSLMWPVSETVYANRISVRRSPCCSNRWCNDRNLLGPVLCSILPLILVIAGIYFTLMFRLSSNINPAYGVINCGGTGNCLLAFQWTLHLPLGTIFLGDFILIFVTSSRFHTARLIAFRTTQVFAEESRAKTQIRMCSKMAVSQLVVWIASFLSNFVCIVTMWQLYAIFTGLQSLYLLVSFVFSRPFLGVLFKRSDPLGRLNLDNLVMHIPLGIYKDGTDLSPDPVRRWPAKTVLKHT